MFPQNAILTFLVIRIVQCKEKIEKLQEYTSGLPCNLTNDNPVVAVFEKRTNEEILITNKNLIVPPGTTISLTCKEVGLYKYVGHPEASCANGNWIPADPNTGLLSHCEATNTITKKYDVSPPTIRYLVVEGSAVEDPPGQLTVAVSSSLRLDCITNSDIVMGGAMWKWRGNAQYTQAWSPVEEERDNIYRLYLRKMKPPHSNVYECHTGQLNNRITIKVTNLQCPPLPPLNLGSPFRYVNDGTNVGQTAAFACMNHYRLVGAPSSICMSNGSWTPPIPGCGTKRLSLKSQSHQHQTAPNSNIIIMIITLIVMFM